MTRSPLWYRRRDAVFGIIYGIGFGVGANVSVAMYGTYRSLLDRIAAHFGTAGFLSALAVMLALTAACFALRVWGSSYLQARRVWNDDSLTDALVIAGPFRFTRNPLYLGNVLMAISIGAFAPLWGWVAIVVLTIAFVIALIHWEERGLRERYGERFAAYCANVPMLVPGFRHAAASAPVSPSLQEGLRGEVFVGCVFLGEIVALIQRGTQGLIVFAALFIAGMILQRVLTSGSPAGLAKE